MTRQLKNYEVVVSVTVSVDAEDEGAAAILANDWTGVCGGAPDEISFICAEVERVSLESDDGPVDEEED
jgi:hypothetical protein